MRLEDVLSSSPPTGRSPTAARSSWIWNGVSSYERSRMSRIAAASMPMAARGTFSVHRWAFPTNCSAISSHGSKTRRVPPDGPTGSNTDPSPSRRARRCTPLSNGDVAVGRAGRNNSQPLTVEADQMQRVPRSRAPLKKYGARPLRAGEICKPSGPVRSRPEKVSGLAAETSSHATAPGGGTSNRPRGSAIRRNLHEHWYTPVPSHERRINVPTRASRDTNGRECNRLTASGSDESAPPGDRDYLPRGRYHPEHIQQRREGRAACGSAITPATGPPVPLRESRTRSRPPRSWASTRSGRPRPTARIA